MNRRDAESRLDNLLEILRTKGEITAASAQSSRRPDDDGKVQPLLDAHGIAHIPSVSAARQVQTRSPHGCFEEVAILGFLDGLELCADHLDAVTVEDSLLCKVDGHVERRLTAEGRQQRVG